VWATSNVITRGACGTLGEDGAARRSVAARTASRTSACFRSRALSVWARSTRARRALAARVHNARSYPSSSQHRLGGLCVPHCANPTGDTAVVALPTERDGQWVFAILQNETDSGCLTSLTAFA
jgi:hypothetical protein